MSYTLTKDNIRVQIRITKDTAEMFKIVGGNTSTTKTVLTPTEAVRKVNELIQEGYTAHKH
jgi:hypothetical protein